MRWSTSTENRKEVEKRIYGTTPRIQDACEDAAFGRAGLTGKILYGPHALDSARPAPAPEINLREVTVPDAVHQMEK